MQQPVEGVQIVVARRADVPKLGFQRFWGGCMPISLLALPFWFRLTLVLQYPPAASTFLGDMDAKYLERAKVQAAALLRQAGFEEPPAGDDDLSGVSE